MFVTESLYKYNVPCKAKCNYWITNLRTKLLTLTLFTVYVVYILQSLSKPRSAPSA